jgi:transposase-like protein
MYGAEIRWRAVTLVYAYSVPSATVARVFGVSDRAVRRWYRSFMMHGHVEPKSHQERTTYPAEVVEFISRYVKNHPCFYVEELRDELKEKFKDMNIPISHATILRVLRFHLKCK